MKSDKQFFHVLAKSFLANVLNNVVKPEQMQAVAEVFNTVDLSVLAGVVEQGMLERTTLKTIKKVDKFMTSAEFIEVQQAVVEVGDAASQVVAVMVAQILAAADSGVPEDVQTEEVVTDQSEG